MSIMSDDHNIVPLNPVLALKNDVDTSHYLHFDDADVCCETI